MPGIFHETLIDRLEAACLKSGLQTKRQAPSRSGRATGYIDLLAWSNETEEMLVIEVEMDSPKRVIGDVQKRRDLGEHAILLLVTPTQRLTKLIQKRLSNLEIDACEPIIVLPFFAALQQLENKNPFCSQVVGGNKKKRKQKSTSPETP